MLAETLGGEDPTGTMSRGHAEIVHLARRLGHLIDDLPASGPPRRTSRNYGECSTASTPSSGSTSRKRTRGTSHSSTTTAPTPEAVHPKAVAQRGIVRPARAIRRSVSVASAGVFGHGLDQPVLPGSRRCTLRPPPPRSSGSPRVRTRSRDRRSRERSHAWAQRVDGGEVDDDRTRELAQRGHVRLRQHALGPPQSPAHVGRHRRRRPRGRRRRRPHPSCPRRTRAPRR